MRVTLRLLNLDIYETLNVHKAQAIWAFVASKSAVNLKLTRGVLSQHRDVGQRGDCPLLFSVYNMVHIDGKLIFLSNVLITDSLSS